MPATKLDFWKVSLIESKAELENLRELRRECISQTRYSPEWDVMTTLRDIDSMIAKVNACIRNAESMLRGSVKAP